MTVWMTHSVIRFHCARLDHDTRLPARVSEVLCRRAGVVGGCPRVVEDGRQSHEAGDGGVGHGAPAASAVPPEQPSRDVGLQEVFEALLN